MKLTHRQKKFIKKNARRLTLAQIGLQLNISTDQVQQYYTNRFKNEASEQLVDGKPAHPDQRASTIKGMIKKYWKYLLGLTLLVILTYANSLFNDFVSDDRYVYLNSATFAHISSAFTYPLFFLRPLLSTLLYKMVGPMPVFYRLLNIFFHIGSVWLVFLIINKLHNRYTAIFTSALFAVHPILIEAVGWISGGPYALYGFFLLLSFLLYISSQENARYYFFSIIFFSLGLFSSEKALVYPAILFCYEVLLGDIKQNWKKLMAFFALSTIWVVWTFGNLGLRLESTTSYAFQPNSEKFYNPLILIPVAITSYVFLFLWPQNLSLYHSYSSIPPVEYWSRVVLFVFLIIFYLYSLKKNKRIFFFLSFFIISIAFTLTPLKIAWVVAERYVYFGSIGIFFLIAYGFYRISQIKRFETFSYFLFASVVCALMIRSIVRNIDWKNEDNLWIATGKTAPDYPVTHNNLGDVYGRHGDIDRSIEEFKKAIELNPLYADAYHNLGNAYRDKKDYTNAIKNYEKATSLNPSLWQSYQNIAAIYFTKKDYNKAEALMKKALTILPQSSQLNSNMGIIYLAKGDKKLAQRYFEKALTLDPTNQLAKQGYIQATSQK